MRIQLALIAAAVLAATSIASAQGTSARSVPEGKFVHQNYASIPGGVRFVPQAYVSIAGGVEFVGERYDLASVVPSNTSLAANIPLKLAR